MGVTIKGFDSISKELKKIVQKEMLMLQDTYQEEVKPRTPIDTGQARRGWQKRQPSLKVREVRNQVDYITKLEKGYSKQAPQGFVNQAVKATLAKRKVK